MTGSQTANILIPPETKEWIPDFFAFLWTQLTNKSHEIVSLPWPKRDDIYTSNYLENCLGNSQGEVHDDVIKYLEGSIPTDKSLDYFKRAYIIASCIDKMIDPLHPRMVESDSLSTAQQVIKEHYVAFDIFNKSDNWGKVLLKPPLWKFNDDKNFRTPHSIYDLFQFLMVFKKGDNDQFQYNFLNVTKFLRRNPEYKFLNELSQKDLLIAVVPLVEGPDELIPIVENRTGANPKIFFQIDNENLFIERIGALLPELNREGVNIIVFPELVFTPAISQALGNLLRSFEGPSNIVLIIAGTSLTLSKDGHSQMPYNECTVLDGFGNTLWTQRKMNHYYIEEERLKKYGIPSEFQGPYQEYMAADVTVNVADSILGRIVVLICEDLHQPHPKYKILQKILPEWIFTPVMSDEIKPGWWEQRHGWAIAETFQTSLVIANSLFFPLRYTDKDRYNVGVAVDCRYKSKAKFFYVDRKQRKGNGRNMPLHSTAHWRPDKWTTYRIVMDHSFIRSEFKDDDEIDKLCHLIKEAVESNGYSIDLEDDFGTISCLNKILKLPTLDNLLGESSFDEETREIEEQAIIIRNRIMLERTFGNVVPKVYARDRN